MNTFLNFVKSKKFLMVAGGVVLVFLAFGFGYPIYDEWKGRRGVKKLADALKQFEIDDYKAAMADTYGGKTPQETLQMYINAIEKGDYELASKYFIGDKQKEELKSSSEMSQVEVKRYVGVLKNSISRFDIDGRYDVEKKSFSLYEPILIRMKIYPNNTWKIIEI